MRAPLVGHDLVDLVGANRVPLGGDTASRLACDDPLVTLQGAGLPPEARARVAGVNAASLLGLAL